MWSRELSDEIVFFPMITVPLNTPGDRAISWSYERQADRSVRVFRAPRIRWNDSLSILFYFSQTIIYILHDQIHIHQTIVFVQDRIRWHRLD
jgi:hypothetical protein